jgi:hypothetical protein
MSNLDPHIGTWKLNVAKSKFSPVLLAAMKQTPPKEETVVCREVGADEFELAVERTQTDGKPVAVIATFPRQGGAVKIQQGNLPDGMTVVSTKIDPNSSCATYMLNGKQVFVAQSVVSKTGKAMRITAKGTDAQGKPFEQVAVLDKQ